MIITNRHYLPHPITVPCSNCDGQKYSKINMLRTLSRLAHNFPTLNPTPLPHATPRFGLCAGAANWLLRAGPVRRRPELELHQKVSTRSSLKTL